MKLTDWDAVRDHLRGATCMWQDLDGFHLEAPPEDPPHTSVLWAWKHAEGSTTAYRLRLGETVTYLASIEASRDLGILLPPWGNRGEVAAAKTHAVSNGTPDPTNVGLRYFVDDRDSLCPIPFYWLPQHPCP